ncbi:thiamine diphosphokinase [Maritimibacter sp. 55A14]|uniref:thiamine diphosphokinase n=1 Tax=Maritimibacter sp. 55A14 TaxID=2174844 RepID=UPI000D60F447|nr:thiamine diphosphokinase [Maritimibacter sp. 55A14]PWE32044.1 thiamine diphosphokinase [Maritimibacter sp. 55A14]
MSGLIVQSALGVTLIGGSDCDSDDLALALRLAPDLVAADSGAMTALRLGRRPKAVIGDMDSLDTLTAAGLDRRTIHRIDEQDTTDFEKCLLRIGAPVILAVGFSGGRLDHELANLNILSRYPQKPCIVIGVADICFHCPPALGLDLAAGTRVSLFPMAPCTGRSTGLRWSIDGIGFAPGGRVGTSNAAEGGPVSLEMDAPGMLVMLPRDELAQAVRAVASAAARDG